MTEEQALELKRKYPWYKPVRIYLDSLNSEDDETLAFHYMFFPKGQQVREVTRDDFRKYEDSLVIDDFLACENVHIIPAEQVTEEDLSQADEQDDELVSEELAEIYLSQGYNDMAVKTYEKLSLLYPEKSIYFAELIENVNKTDKE